MGGRAFQDVNPVNKRDIKGATQGFTKLLGIDNYQFLGSTGKKPISGDIDISISGADYQIHNVLVRAQALLGPQSVNVRGITMDQLYCRYEYKGIPVQIDITVGYLPLLEFTYWAPHPDSSQYSGLHRTELIKAVAKSQAKTATRNGEVVARTGYTLLPNKGLILGSRWRKPSMTGGFVKKMTPVPRESWAEYISRFPELSYQIETVIQEPNQIAELLFGMTDYSPEKLNSYEDVSRELCRNRHLSYNPNLIWQLYVERLSVLGATIPQRMI